MINLARKVVQELIKCNLPVHIAIKLPVYSPGLQTDVRVNTKGDCAWASKETKHLVSSSTSVTVQWMPRPRQIEWKISGVTCPVLSCFVCLSHCSLEALKYRITLTSGVASWSSGSFKRGMLGIGIPCQRVWTSYALAILTALKSCPSTDRETDRGGQGRRMGKQDTRCC